MQIDLSIAQIRATIKTLVSSYNKVEIGVWLPNWKAHLDGTFESKFSIYYDYQENQFKVESLTSERCPCVLYFRTHKIATDFIRDNKQILSLYFSL